MRTIVIGSRGSKLALRQTELVAEGLQQIHNGLKVEIAVIHTQGDKVLDVALSKIGDKGLFTKEIEVALLNREIDLAVHSLKDMPTALPEGLELGAVLSREESSDVLVSPSGKKLAEMPSGAVIGTSSLRRQAQLLAQRPDLKVVDLRGNLETRIRKMQELKMDGIILAWAGLARMNMLDLVTEVLGPEVMLPAAGQGAMAIEVRKDDTEVKQLISVLDSLEARLETTAERAFLAGMGGGCQVPIGARGKVSGDRISLTGMVASLDGKKLIRIMDEKSAEQADLLGSELARQVIEMGGKQILDSIIITH
ncbi:MAG: hydroxymethylbilane synthase [Methylocystaceae bacterium]